MKLGLRIDVDTFRGTRDGLPALRRLLDSRGIRASFFLTVGPDNMGRHIWRLLRPSFLMKMLRSGAPNIYGWDILLRGTLGSGPLIHKRLNAQLSELGRDGHEIGTHAWDHHWWQVAAHVAGKDRLQQEMQRAHDAIADAVGRAPTCAAAPGWRCTPDMLASREGLGYTYASDCRGQGVFQPDHGPPQICVNLPTWDEAVGRDGVTNATFNTHLFNCMNRDDMDVLTVHTETEGGRLRPLFEDFLDRAVAEGIECVALSDLLPSTIDPGAMVQGRVAGREGWVAVREVAA
ncbi:MAG: polysaccharide deacetylase family protein [Phycisphaerales bacterium]|jgi:undecaprenyl phosphate-alpha-L-ara4FN deformylase|nr:polysaccharide deacetylase family protein [Phycisphaerales bacterium]